MNLDLYLEYGDLDLADFYAGSFEQFTWQGQRYGIPFIAAPELIYFNKSLFDAAGLPYPTDDWTWEDVRSLARKLTLDEAGRNAEESDFDAEKIVQWGYNASPGSLGPWAIFFVAPFGGDFCANSGCTQVDFTSEPNL